MSGLFWSGPGRALQFHLDTFHDVARVHGWIDANVGRQMRPELVPTTFRQRLNLMSSMQMLGPQLMHDGVTVATQKDDQSIITTRFNVERTSGLLHQEYTTLNQAETHYVSHHIMSAVEAAAELADDEPLFPTDLPAPSGLMVFEYPLIMPDLHPMTGETMKDLRMPVRAIAWHKSEVYARRLDIDDAHIDEPGRSELERREGIFYVLYTDAESYEAIFVESARRVVAEHYNEDFNPETIKEGLGIWATDCSGWAFGMSWKRAGIDQPRDAFGQGEIHDTVATVRRFMLAYFRWCWQRILVPQTYTPTRHEMKRAKRSGKHLEDGYVKVLRLRRHVEAEARGERIDADQLAYDFQWIVKGHPRRQWFPSLGPARNDDGSFNVDSHRLIWIEPFTKGNPYAPLVIGHNVVAAVR